MNQIGPFPLNKTYEGDCLDLIPQLPDESVNIVVTSPPYWGKGTRKGSVLKKIRGIIYGFSRKPLWKFYLS